MKIQFQVSKPVLCGNERRYVIDALDSGWISSNGAYLPKFEKAIAETLRVDECLSTSNGTTALHLACLSLGLKPGDEVIVPSLTYVASANAIAYCGARPIFADCDPLTWNATSECIAKVWTPRTVGVLAVHLYGMPTDIDKIAELCRSRGAWLLEDCAESLGATIFGKPTGSFGDASTFSFYGNKTISTGEGGALYVQDPERRRHARMLRGQGMDLNHRYWHPILGYNYRMTNIAAAIGLGQIEMLDFHLAERRRIAACYFKQLRPLEAEGLLRLPTQVDGYSSSYWLFSAVLTGGGDELRARIMNQLATEYGIETRPFFVPMHRLPMYFSEESLPKTEFLATHGMNFPTYTGLSDADVDEICGAIGHVLRTVS
ncbi:DegT/DnrJ/EryC1/StrS family aminotransferase [Bradyrhizobium iriomotense]|uniref:DegT/DnrJ/EryC1/StrS family aminotransferase n=1 Tax=Bradyrhizobium iriomotense TaxID=441950 RepID=UPI001B8A4B57|nr:DegT/DnrJ/EryC1/StrS family aminotransferase [Bradyrhizobium iriomotense]MBR1133264.1 DegT/DnrJ/EryC1/StrS family aminotransferase [Bradyrhizobium iriomotense]